MPAFSGRPGRRRGADASCSALLTLLMEDGIFHPMKTSVSAKGQIVLPAEIRRQDGIEPGEEFKIERIENFTCAIE
jgi:AbrB family looped-hinge helix DNA binding protein